MLREEEGRRKVEGREEKEGKKDKVEEGKGKNKHLKQIAMEEECFPL